MPSVSSYTPFWREDPFTSAEEKLLEAVELAHRASACRNNASSGAVKNAAASSGRLETALASGLMALGGAHAPIAEITKFLSDPEFEKIVEERLLLGAKILGWGNSFFKGKSDPVWEPVGELLADFPVSNTINFITGMLRDRGKVLFPNAGCFTGATAIVLRMPAAVSPYLLIRARLPVWTALASQHL